MSKKTKTAGRKSDAGKVLSPVEAKVAEIAVAVREGLKDANGEDARILAVADTTVAALDRLQGGDTLDALKARTAEVRRMVAVREMLVPALLTVKNPETGRKMTNGQVAARLGVNATRITQIKNTGRLMAAAESGQVDGFTVSDARKIARGGDSVPSIAEAEATLKSGKRPSIVGKDDDDATVSAAQTIAANLRRAVNGTRSVTVTAEDAEALAQIVADAERLAQWAAGLVAAQEKRSAA